MTLGLHRAPCPEVTSKADFAVPASSQRPLGRLALVVVLQLLENLTDQQAAGAVRARIDWMYARGLELTDAGFDYSVLSDFQDRLRGAEVGREILDGVLAAARRQGLVAAGGCTRTDSTHGLSAARELNWLEFAGEMVRSALNAVAQRAGVADAKGLAGL